MGFDVREHVKFTDMVSVNLWETYHSPSFSVVSKKNIHSYLWRLLKESSLSQLHICGKLDFLHGPIETTDPQGPNAEADTKDQLLSQTLKKLAKL